MHPLDPLTAGEIALAVAVGRELHPGLQYLTASTTYLFGCNIYDLRKTLVRQ